MAALTSPQSCDERGEAVAYDGDVDEDILHVAPLARFLRSSHNFKPTSNSDGPKINTHNAREAARRAHYDAFGNDRGAPWRNPTDGGG